MSTISLFAVRHVPSGGYLPQPTGYAGRGGSHVEPVVHVDDLTKPRLFSSKRAATNALSQWRRGKFTRSAGYDSYAMEYYDDIDITPVPERLSAPMEIVELLVVLP